MIPDSVQPLIDLGFTDLEARIYLCLLAESPQTGYAVARSIGKPAANTYKALEGLARKQAVIIDEGENRLCRAVEAERVFDRLEQRFSRSRGEATDLVNALNRSSGDDRIYQLRSPEQVVDQAATLLADARQVVVADLFPEPLERLRADLEAAAARGVRVCVLAYAEAQIPGVQIQHPPRMDYAVEAWPGQHLALAADAEQHLYGLLSRDLTRVHQAVWSESLYLSCMAHNHLATEFELAELRSQDARPLRDQPIRLVRDDLPGFRRLKQQE